MIRIGIVSYNIYCNFTNYGSALQSWALYQSIKRISPDLYQPVLVDYCPDSLSDKDPLNPFSNMWDQDPESRKMCELSLPAIREYYGAAEPPVRCGESHLSGLTEPPQFVY